jgi:spore coat polysaccharide biosynthesis predicted glycosyltransferase SpsG
MHIVFITEGSEAKGMGHIYRTLTLASEMISKADLSFIINDDEITQNLIKEHGFSVYKAEDDDAINRVAANLKPEVLVLDKLNINENFARELRVVTGSKLVIFENNSKANLTASLVINAVLDNNFKNNRYLDNQNQTLYLKGPRYWILRPEFYEYKKKDKTPKHEIRNITMVFGGSDPSNLSSKVLSQLLKLNSEFQLDLCLGAHFKHYCELNQVLAVYPEKRQSLNLHINEKNIARLMYGADLVLTSPGTCAFEALYLGTPIIAISHNSEQAHIFKGYLKTITEKRLAGIKDMIEQGEYVFPNQPEIIAAEIGEGKKEVLKAIIDLL